MKKLVLGAVAAAVVAGSMVATVDTASARSGRHGALAAGAIAGVIGGALLGGALRDRSYDDGPDYYEEPAYAPRPVYVQPRCYWEKRRVRNTYDYGYHIERVKVCDAPDY